MVAKWHLTMQITDHVKQDNNGLLYIKNVETETQKSNEMFYNSLIITRWPFETYIKNKISEKNINEVKIPCDLNPQYHKPQYGLLKTEIKAVMQLNTTVL